MNSLKRATLVTFVAGLGLFLATTSAAAATIVADRVNDQIGVQGQSGDFDRNSQEGVQGQSGDLDRNSQEGVQGQSGELDKAGQTGFEGQSGEVSGPNDGVQGQSGQSN
ncbi:MAG: hypothetical protein M3Z28_12035 [Candidatus Dormibacteraeota bacterium]|nr:hypothetical protein [Candidatus Dormibacteraeota bacterium]